MATATTFPAPLMSTTETSNEPRTLEITLSDGATVSIELRGVDPTTTLRGIFMAGFFSDGARRFYAAAQIKSAVAR